MLINNSKESDGRMLDSNTDRSYFMIGAVIIGAIIIGAAAWIFGDFMFAEGDGALTTMLKSMFSSAGDTIDNIKPGTPGSGGGGTP